MGPPPAPHPSGPGPAPSAPAPLLVACALGIEQLALRAGARATGRGGGPAGPVTVLRTGMGAAAARRSVARALGAGPLTDAAVLATGFCAGLAPGMNPGDLVVAEETHDPEGGVRCTATGPLVKELTRALPGRTVHTGILTGTDHVVRGAERRALRAGGAVAADMESAATLLTAVRAGTRPVAAVRVVVDAPEYELVRIGTFKGGMTAFHVLCRVLPAFFAWHRSLPSPRR
ncbi:1-hydroxy-2-methyl-2-butenyl 4-diphosphate reductase [Streptomyces sp. MJP52]|uniref:phosphorylase family protein n=1 Tax=Streptomyces sp. MJP52 TaxID=2940555 RepID=UPI0024765A5F|nr:1-hydroxy-2-methyl-2-butenyl 4-diphosphate reductase [Streptomyces sp. MJP52]MDH6223329.1 nucleoside phosphorylase [Streptomyces sp. MJP52]